MEEFLRPFYHAADNVFKDMFSLEVQKGLFQSHQKYITTLEANINIGVTGDLTGSVIYSFSKDFALSIANMMAGMEFDELNEFVGSAVGELANIISGNAMTKLSEYNYHCDIVPPEVFLGLGKSMIITNSNIITIPIKTDIGNFDINVSVKTR
ncbi:chemotaxis protein CheX [Natronospora cellulosivora (SeqCode)]